MALIDILDWTVDLLASRVGHPQAVQARKHVCFVTA